MFQSSKIECNEGRRSDPWQTFDVGEPRCNGHACLLCLRYSTARMALAGTRQRKFSPKPPQDDCRQNLTGTHLNKPAKG